MEEAFPIKFCKGVRSYWRRRKYQKLKGSATSNKTVARLGGGQQGSTRRFWKLRSGIKLRFSIPSPVQSLRRLRDTYINAMLGLPAMGSSVSNSVGEKALVARRIPRAKSRTVRSQPGDFEQRLILEIYKSVMASNKLSAD